ncbi:CubicO group peptidase (beta-lactamase class C family) [Salirhabdus euzebyi]|uniref:CubicO group peptidase (Beta-lactamase class C family) n=1 Tax=Salirhabdus euzebyi TaxID=394506 RepID=A0A841PUC2_9BACI|nr:serine hydrolase domain-containing protein [Salirhabdus euzebyi]MBB6452597.1 CubicO group peptidase (beta-lactamase class C family) [Salirhabdus euzebyi]
MINIPYDLIKKDMNAAKNASYALGVVTGEERIVAGEFYDNKPGIPTEKRIFEIGSTTKTFTSLLLAKLVLEGRVALDEPIVTYKPAYKKALTYDGKEVTFRHLATHTSRLPREDIKTLRKIIKEDKQNRDNIYKHYSLDYFHDFYMQHDLKKEIGKKWGYSNIGVALLGNVLSEIVGMDYEEAIKIHILNPLGMHDTFIRPTEEQLSRYVHAYNKKGEMIPPLEFGSLHGAGAFRSTIDDMMIYLQHQLEMTDNPLKEAIAFTHQDQGVKAFKGVNMGLSWFIEEKKWSDYPLIHHGGTTIGFHTYFGFIKELQIGIVMYSTVQMSLLKILKILLRLSDGINENVANDICKDYIRAQKGL